MTSRRPALAGDKAPAPTFRISYSGRDPRTVMRVTERLASLFIEESLRDRSALAEGTNQFLETELQEARNRLIEQEKRLEAYRQQHAGELPSQLNSNMQAIQNIQVQLQSLSQSITRTKIDNRWSIGCSPRRRRSHRFQLLRPSRRGPGARRGALGAGSAATEVPVRSFERSSSG